MNIEHQKYEHVKKEYAKISVALIREYIEVIHDIKEEKILRGIKQRKFFGRHGRNRDRRRINV